MKTETSAGGVIIDAHAKTPSILLLKDKNGKWTFPKGLIEKKEDRESTAKREIAEEVGLTKLTLVKELTPIQYLYKWEGKLVKKTVYYFLFSGDSKKKLKPQIEEGIMDVQWFPIEKAIELIGYRKTNKGVLKEAMEVSSKTEI